MTTDQGLGPLLERLRKGQAWLASTHRILNAMPDAGVGSPEEETFNDAFALWITLEGNARAFGYARCVIGERGCDPAAPIICLDCAKVTK
jgi:hypothetical protein